MLPPWPTSYGKDSETAWVGREVTRAAPKAPVILLAVAEGRGFYNEHSSQQAEASDAGVSMVRDAVAALPGPPPRPLVIADFGSSQGRNSLAPLAAAIAEARRREADPDLPVAVVHTDLAANDFSTLFATVAADPATYAGPNIFTYAAGRSFYERLFPDDSVMLGWSSTTVLWLSHTPDPIPDHLFSYPATGAVAQRWAASAADDWSRFLGHRAVEFRTGAQLVVTALVADPEVLPWMATVEQGGRDAVDDGVLTAAQLEAMVVPTILRDADDGRRR